MSRGSLGFEQSAGYLKNFWVRAATRDGRFSAYPAAPAPTPEPRPRKRVARAQPRRGLTMRPAATAVAR